MIVYLGCCPEDDEDGTPYGPGKACCCGKIYADDGTRFCCEERYLIFCFSLKKID